MHNLRKSYNRKYYRDSIRSFFHYKIMFLRLRLAGKCLKLAYKLDSKFMQGYENMIIDNHARQAFEDKPYTVHVKHHFTPADFDMPT